MRFNKRVQKYLEKAYAHSYDFDPVRPPLEVEGSLVSRWGPGDKFVRLNRSNLSLNLVTLGNARYVQNGREGSVAIGELFIAHRGGDQLFETGPAGFLHKRSIMLHGGGLDSMIASLGLLEHDIIRPLDRSGMIALFRRTYRLLQDKHPRFGIELSGVIYEILLRCAESVAHPVPTQLRRALDHINRNLHRSLTLDEIAHTAGVSPRHCTRLFRQYQGCSPNSFCIQQKMAIARTMLLNTTLSSKQIALTLGYVDPLYFSGQFKKIHGIGPRALREKKAMAG